MEPLCPADPRTVGPWKILGRIGAGGMGTVLLLSAAPIALVRAVDVTGEQSGTRIFGAGSFLRFGFFGEI